MCQHQSNLFAERYRKMNEKMLDLARYNKRISPGFVDLLPSVKSIKLNYYMTPDPNIAGELVHAHVLGIIAFAGIDGLLTSL